MSKKILLVCLFESTTKCSNPHIRKSGPASMHYFTSMSYKRKLMDQAKIFLNNLSRKMYYLLSYKLYDIKKQ